MNAQRNFEKNLVDNININVKGFFAYARKKQRTRDKVGPLKNNDGVIIEDDMETATVLNDYFGSVFTKENSLNLPVPKQMFLGSENDKLTDIIVTEIDVLKFK